VPQLNENKSVVVIGPFGAAKTSLINFLCKTNFAEGGGTISCTKFEDIGKNTGKWYVPEETKGNEPIDVILDDTPGFSTSDYASIKNHLQILAMYLAGLPIYKIIICVSSQERMHDTTKNMLLVLKESFRDFQSRFILLFTKFENKWAPIRGRQKSFEEWYKEEVKHDADVFDWFPHKIPFTTYPIPAAVTEQSQAQQKLWRLIYNEKYSIESDELQAIRMALLQGEEELLEKAISNMYSYSLAWRVVCGVPGVGTFAAIAFHFITYQQERKLRSEWKAKKLTLSDLVKIGE